MMARRRKSRSPSDFCFFPPPLPHFVLFYMPLYLSKLIQKTFFFPFLFISPPTPPQSQKQMKKKRDKGRFSLPLGLIYSDWGIKSLSDQLCGSICLEDWCVPAMLVILMKGY